MTADGTPPQERECTMTTKWIKRRRSRIIRGIIFAAALIVFLYSGFQLLQIFGEYKRGSDEYQDLAGAADKILSSAEENIKENGDLQGQPAAEEDSGAWKELYETMSRDNEDYVGWIVIEDTKINYPIVQGSDNDYYLSHTFEGKENSSGTLFVDYRIEEGMEGKHVLVYGHNMKNGSMFAGLKKYREDEFYEQHKTFRVYTKTGLYTYEIFAVREIPADSDAYTLWFADDADFMSYIKKMQADSIQSTGVTVEPGDRIITLSTCVNNNVDRLIIQAKRL